MSLNILCPFRAKRRSSCQLQKNPRFFYRLCRIHRQWDCFHTTSDSTYGIPTMSSTEWLFCCLTSLYRMTGCGKGGRGLRKGTGGDNWHKNSWASTGFWRQTWLKFCARHVQLAFLGVLNCYFPWHFLFNVPRPSYYTPRSPLLTHRLRHYNGVFTLKIQV